MINAVARRSALGMMMLAGIIEVRPAEAAPPLTTIQDTLYRADGSLYSGYVEIEWKSFEAADKSVVPAQSLSLRVYNGQFRTKLIPTTNASAGAVYSIRYLSDGRLQGIEKWAVPPAAGAVRLTTVRVPPGSSTLPPGGVGGPFDISDVIGLQEALDTRPRKGAGYAPGRAAIINSLGEIESALGADSDCITVEGAGANCQSVSGTLSFVDGEVPAGDVNGVNNSFELANPPNPVSSLLLYRNGLYQRHSVDYTLSGTTIAFLPAAIPTPGDLLVASYRLTGSGSGTSQILCSSVGAATTSTSEASLGTCTVPANLLHPGDRVEIFADFTHEGAAIGFTVGLKWGAATLISRGFPASDSAASIRLSVGVHTLNTAFGGQSWSSGQAVASVGGALVASYATPLTIDLLANMAAPAEGVTLRNYTVIRYPVP